MIRNNIDGYLVWSSNSSNIQIDRLLTVLVRKIKRNSKVRIYYPPIDAYVNIRIHVFGVLADGVMRNKFSFVGGLTGEASVCCKCLKKFTNCDVINEQCERRSGP